MRREHVDGIVGLVIMLKRYDELFDASEIEWFKLGVRELLRSGFWPYRRALPNG